MAESDASLRKAGMEALIGKLGLADAQRFILLIKKDSFDYARWREKLFEAACENVKKSQEAVKETV
ncbi:MAG: hypothetical protein LBC41_10235 [Clostridiales bacterium]|jgi:hypothetical protein|nr:hypothetical protein [Clostridiales bacterium]MDR2751029.1 hypothetical protein [Clostridiales bacterium]